MLRENKVICANIINLIQKFRNVTTEKNIDSLIEEMICCFYSKVTLLILTRLFTESRYLADI